VGSPVFSFFGPILVPVYEDYRVNRKGDFRSSNNLEFSKSQKKIDKRATI